MQRPSSLTMLAPLLLVASCSREPPPTSDCPKCPDVNAAVGKPAEIAVRNTCINTADDILIHVAIDARYTGRRASENGGKSRDLWQIRCKKKSGECEGTSVSFDEAFTKGIGVFDVNTIAGARLVAMQGQVATIKWGPLRTFTIDFAERIVRYTESSNDLEGRGEARCPAE